MLAYLENQKIYVAIFILKFSFLYDTAATEGHFNKMILYKILVIEKERKYSVHVIYQIKTTHTME